LRLFPARAFYSPASIGLRTFGGPSANAGCAADLLAHHQGWAHSSLAVAARRQAKGERRAAPPACAPRAKRDSAAGIGLRAFYGALRPMPAVLVGVSTPLQEQQSLTHLYPAPRTRQARNECSNSPSCFAEAMNHLVSPSRGSLMWQAICFQRLTYNTILPLLYNTPRSQGISHASEGAKRSKLTDKRLQ